MSVNLSAVLRKVERVANVISTVSPAIRKALSEWNKAKTEGGRISDDED